MFSNVSSAKKAQLAFMWVAFLLFAYLSNTNITDVIVISFNSKSFQGQEQKKEQGTISGREKKIV